MDRYRFALRPKWLLSHVLILILIVVMINLGFWQLRRLDEKKTYNRSVQANESLAAVPVESLLQPTDPTSRGGDLAFRRVTITGQYDLGNEVIIRARSLTERPGVWVATPLRLPNGDGVLVVRGFLPTQGTPDSIPLDAEPPIADITVRASCKRRRRGDCSAPRIPKEPAREHRFESMSSVCSSRCRYRLYPVFVQLTSSDPAQNGREPEACRSPCSTKGRTSATRCSGSSSRRSRSSAIR